MRSNTESIFFQCDSMRNSSIQYGSIRLKQFWNFECDPIFWLPFFNEFQCEIDIFNTVLYIFFIRDERPPWRRTYYINNQYRTIHNIQIKIRSISNILKTQYLRESQDKIYKKTFSSKKKLLLLFFCIQFQILQMKVEKIVWLHEMRL